MSAEVPLKGGDPLRLNGWSSLIGGGPSGTGKPPLGAAIRAIIFFPPLQDVSDKVDADEKGKGRRTIPAKPNERLVCHGNHTLWASAPTLQGRGGLRSWTG